MCEQTNHNMCEQIKFFLSFVLLILCKVYEKCFLRGNCSHSIPIAGPSIFAWKPKLSCHDDHDARWWCHDDYDVGWWYHDDHDVQWWFQSQNFGKDLFSPISFLQKRVKLFSPERDLHLHLHLLGVHLSYCSHKNSQFNPGRASATVWGRPVPAKMDEFLEKVFDPSHGPFLGKYTAFFWGKVIFYIFLTYLFLVKYKPLYVRNLSRTLSRSEFVFRKFIHFGRHRPP